MKDHTVDKDFVVREYEGNEKAVLWPGVGKKVHRELRPTGCYILKEGAVGDKPSLCFVLMGEDGKPFYAQISKQMFQPVLKVLEGL